MLRHITLLGRCAAVVRDDDLSLLKEFVSYAHAFAEQPAGIAAEIENQALNVVFTELAELFFEFFAGVFAKLSHVDVGDAGL